MASVRSPVSGSLNIAKVDHLVSLNTVSITYSNITYYHLFTTLTPYRKNVDLKTILQTPQKSVGDGLIFGYVSRRNEAHVHDAERSEKYLLGDERF